MRRRDFMKALGLLSAATLWPAVRRLDAAAQAPEASKGMAFSAGEVQKQARAVAAEKFVPPKIDLPIFRAFWIEQPPAEAHALVVNALLDSV